jgi:hypothetical protein
MAGTFELYQDQAGKERARRTCFAPLLDASRQ